MKKNVIFSVILASFLMLGGSMMVMSCSGVKGAGISVADEDDGTVVTRNRKVGKFTAIKIYGSPTVRFVQGDGFSVQVKGGERYVDNIETVVDGDRLVVSVRKNTNIGVSTLNWLGIVNDHKNKLPEVYVTAPDLVGVTLDGSGDFVCEGPLDTDMLDIMLSGSGDVDFKGAVVCDKLKARLHGSGDIDINNVEALTSEIELRGSGDIEVSQKNVNDTNLKLIGSGDIKVSLKDCVDINCNLAGSGDITLKGNIKGRLSKAKAGSGDYHIELSR